jgi:hypothetical protein
LNGHAPGEAFAGPADAEDWDEERLGLQERAFDEAA